MIVPVAFSLQTIFTLLILVLSAQDVWSVKQFALKISGCQNAESTLERAVEFMRGAAIFGEDRTRLLLDALRNNLSPDAGAGTIVEGDDFSVFMLFETLFGALDPYTGFKEVEKVAEWLANFNMYMRKPKYRVNIVCGDNFFREISRDPKSGLIVALDERPAYWGGGTTYERMNPADIWWCEHHPTTQAYSSAIATMRPEEVDVIVVCPATTDVRKKTYYNSLSLSQMQGQSLAPESIHLEDYQDNNLGFILIHEFSHSMNINPPNRETEDDAYGWLECTELAKIEPQKAMLNADTIGFYLLALALRNNDWSTGRNLPIPPALPGPVRRLEWRDGAWTDPNAGPRVTIRKRTR